MKVEKLKKYKAPVELRAWLAHPESLPEIPDDYVKMRIRLEEFHKTALKYAKEKGGSREYLYDIHFGVELYNYLTNQKWMSLRLAANDEFWIYLSIKVIPDIVRERYADRALNVLEERFYKTPARIWLKTIWWFIHLGWPEDSSENEIKIGSSLSQNGEKTLEFFTRPMFNNDVMTNITERTGRNGMYLELYREILKVYGERVNGVFKKEKAIAKYKRYLAKGDSDTLMRAVMRLHTAKMLVVDPCLAEGGIPGYVYDLFSEFTRKLDKYPDIENNPKKA